MCVCVCVCVCLRLQDLTTHELSLQHTKFSLIIIQFLWENILLGIINILIIIPYSFIQYCIPGGSISGDGIPGGSIPDDSTPGSSIPDGFRPGENLPVCSPGRPNPCPSPTVSEMNFPSAGRRPTTRWSGPTMSTTTPVSTRYHDDHNTSRYTLPCRPQHQ